jgi:hypothetical protein
VELVNHTPFPSLAFQSQNVQGQDFHVIVLRATFRIHDGQPLRPDTDQRPLVTADEYYGEPTSSSIRMESDLAPFKPRSDIHIIADAHAPGGCPTREWNVRVRVGSLEKTLHVTGRRYWRKALLGWTLTEPEACLTVPIRYEHAYGGVWQDGDQMDVFLENPVGCGHLPAGRLHPSDRIEAPQIESPECPISSPGKAHHTEGLGPTCRGWQPRLGLAGTFDQDWIDKRWPMLPLNFDYAHYNSAPPGLIVEGYLRGDESVELENLTSPGYVRFRLPGYAPFLLGRRVDGMIFPAPLVLDTFVIDLPNDLAFLVWRGQLATGPPLRVIEIRMELNGGTNNAG